METSDPPLDTALAVILSSGRCRFPMLNVGSGVEGRLPVQNDILPSSLMALIMPETTWGIHNTSGG